MSNVLKFDTFNLTITPNTPPDWSAEVSYLSFQAGIRILEVSLPIYKIQTGYQMIDLELWVDDTEKQDETTMSLSGTPTSVRAISILTIPTVITPCDIFLDVDEDEDDVPDYAEYNVIYAERFEDAALQLFDGTEWKLRIDCPMLEDFPVVTEMEPLLVLNGSLLEQLTVMLEMFTPNDLWGQTLQYVANPFTMEVIVFAPKGGDSQVNSLDVVDAKIFDVSVTESDLTRPEKIYIQEDPSSSFRHIDHFSLYGYRTYDYAYDTTLHANLVEREHFWSYKYDDWERYVDISAELTGLQELMGNLVVTDTSTSLIMEVETKLLYTEETQSFKVPKVGNPSWDFNNITYKWIITRGSQVRSRDEYTYIIGPPYNDPAYYYPCAGSVFAIPDKGDNWWLDLPFIDSDGEEHTGEINMSQTVDSSGNLICMDWENKCFPSSLPGTTRQLARDNGAIIIDKNNLPPYITSTDGIRVSRKKSVAIETSSADLSFYTSEDSEFYFFNMPAFEDLAVSEQAVIVTDENYSYDEEGVLTGARTREVARTLTQITVTDTFKFYRKITDELMSVARYSTQKTYSIDWVLLGASLTNITVDTISGTPTGPSAVSPTEAIEGDTVSREKMYRQDDSRIVLKLYRGDVSQVTDSMEGVTYVSMDNLTIEEMEAYLDAYYNTGPNVEYTVGFSSRHLDVRGIIGGHLRLTSSLDPNRPASFEAEDASVNELHSSGIMEAMQISPFRANGITMNWDKEGQYTVALTARQVI